MFVNIEFLGGEPIENVITCMNFQIDKTIFFGYAGVIEEQREAAVHFLKKYCKVKEVIFQSLPHTDLPVILEMMRAAIRREIEQGNQVFFDVTGGESLILVAFGILSREFETPMHMYDVEGNRLIELEEGVEKSIGAEGVPQKVQWNLDSYIEMYGGVINYQLHKELKDADHPDFGAVVGKIWDVARKHDAWWNPFSDFCRKHFIPDAHLQVSVSARTVISALHAGRNNLTVPAKLNQILDDLERAGALDCVKHENGRYSFRYHSKSIQDCLWGGGSILELYTFLQERNGTDDCRVGVHIDWDGVIHQASGIDVLNEVDVLALRGNIPTFISCKSGKMGSAQSLHALYELETVAKRFGGRYARKVLVTTKPMANVYLSRAEEMGIEVRNLGCRGERTV